MSVLRTGLVAAIFIALSAPVLAQGKDVIPERRIELSNNTDFPGGDLRNIFDVTFNDCVAACLADNSCKAFTYNENSNACFPKTGVSERVGFSGATSAEVFETPSALLTQARNRAAMLPFLPQRFTDNALRIAIRNGAWYPTNGWSYDALIAEALKEERAGNHTRGMELALAALNDDDRADGWIEVARLANAADPQTSRQRSFVRDVGSAAAINGFYRAVSAPQQTTALMELAAALERQNLGRLSIPILRLASDITPRQDVDQALDRAINLFGFRIVDHSVDHNAERPRVCAQFSEELVEGNCSIPDDHIDPRRSALFMARSILNEVRDGRSAC